MAPRTEGQEVLELVFLDLFDHLNHCVGEGNVRVIIAGWIVRRFGNTDRLWKELHFVMLENVRECA